MISSVDVGDATGDIAREIADETHGDPADVLDGDEPPLGRSRAGLVDQLVEVIDTRGGSGLERPC